MDNLHIDLLSDPNEPSFQYTQLVWSGEDHGQISYSVEALFGSNISILPALLVYRFMLKVVKVAFEM